MKTEQATYLDFLGMSNTQMAIPVFQRIYTWGAWQCDELLEDILRAGLGDESHFIGTIVYTDEEVGAEDAVRGVSGPEAFAPSDDAPAGPQVKGTADIPATERAAAKQGERETDSIERLFNIIDGQQRTTTVTLLLIALRDYLRKQGGTAGGNSAEDIERTFLYIEGDGLRIQKFIAAPADKDTLAAVLYGSPLPEDYLVSKCVVDNFAYFQERLQDIDPDQLWRGLRNLFAIIIELGDDDNPQIVFESINSKGMGLATSDLLRNRLFFEQDAKTRDRLLTQYWEPLEALFEEDPNQNNFNAAIRRWLVEKDESLSDRSPYELFSVFRKFVEEHYPDNMTEELMAELLASCAEFRRKISDPQAKSLMRQHLFWAEGHTKPDTGSGSALFG